jgi:chorismate mutase / prephenate dehydratase
MTDASPLRPSGRPHPASGNLADVRRDIDALDDAILELLGKRFAIVEQVGELKRSQGAGSPLRPAREAQVLQRLSTKARELGLHAALPVWLWPVIFAEADLVQAPVQLVLGEHLAGHVGARLALQRRFGRIPVVTVADEAAALATCCGTALSVAVVSATSRWLEHYLDQYVAGGAGRAQVMGVLLTDDGDRLMIVGQSPGEITGKDETLVVSRGSLPRDFPLRPLWSIVSGALQLSALPGYLSEKEAPLLGIIRSNGSLGLRVAGRYPAVFG